MGRMLNKIKKDVLNLIPSIMAGVMISIGCLVNLSCDNKYVGAVFFSIALFTILVFKFQLFTGMVGYVRQIGVINLISVWIGNFIGILISVLLINHTRLNSFKTKAETIVQVKNNDTYISLFILSIFCGLLMYIAVSIFNTKYTDVIKILAIFMCVIVFILISFEHCIANMFYYSFTGLTLDSVSKLMVMTIGNSIGANVLNVFKGAK